MVGKEIFGVYNSVIVNLMMVDTNSEMPEQHEAVSGSAPLSPRTRDSVYVTYGVFVLLLSAFRLLKGSYLDTIAGIETLVDFLYYIYGVSGTYLYNPIIGLLVAYGLISRKGWARYGVIAAMLTLPVTLPLLLMVYGPLFGSGAILFHIFIAVLLVAFFVRFPASQDSDTKFRVKSFAGVLVLVILALSVRPIVPTLYLKYKANEPLFISKAKTIVINPDKYKAGYEHQRKLETPEASFYIPYGYHVVSAETGDNSWEMMLLNDKEDEKGTISVGNNRPGDNLFNRKEFERLGITNGLAFYRFMLTDNWSPGAVAYRSLLAHGGYEFSEFNLGERRGFLWITEEEHPFYEIGLYGRDGHLILAGEVYYHGNNKDNSQQIAESIISSVDVTPPLQNDSDYYKDGVDLYNRNNLVDAQFAFAQAYFQTPNNPEYAYMLVKSLVTEKHHFYRSMERILEGSLKANPGNEKLKELLEEIKEREEEEG